jgi:hypothetical protein
MYPMPSSIPQDMQDALDRFTSDAEKIINSFLQSLQSLPQARPPIIYHYTHDVGLRGILESGRLWLTDIFNLNDPSELRHGLSPAINIMNKRAANGSPVSQIFAKAFEQGFEESGKVFVCSFSSRGNELGQWRAYADNGRGYVLAFDTKALEATFTGGTRSQAHSRSHMTTPSLSTYTASS